MKDNPAPEDEEPEETEEKAETKPKKSTVGRPRLPPAVREERARKCRAKHMATYWRNHPDKYAEHKERCRKAWKRKQLSPDPASTQDAEQKQDDENVGADVAVQ